MSLGTKRSIAAGSTLPLGTATPSTASSANLGGRACALLIFIGLSVSLGNFVLPALVGVFQDGFGFTLSQSGFLASAYMSGGGVGAVVLSLMILRAHTIWLCGIALVAVMAGYLLVSVADTYPHVLAAVGLAGVGEGAALALMAGGLSRARAPDRMYGLFTFLAISLGAVGFLVIPLITAIIGASALFIVFALVPATALFFIRSLPDLRRSVATAQTSLGGSVRQLTFGQRVMFVSGLSSALLIYTAKGGFWSYLDRIGVSIGLDVVVVSQILALGSIAGALGAGFAAFLNSRWGRGGPVLISLLIQVIALLVVVIFGSSMMRFAGAVIVFYFIWYFFIANLLGLMSAADRAGRLVSALLAAQTAGLAIGPAVAAMMVSARDFSALAPFGAATYIAGALLLIPVFRAAHSSRDN